MFKQRNRGKTMVFLWFSHGFSHAFPRKSMALPSFPWLFPWRNSSCFRKMRVFPKAQPEVRTASAEAGLDYGDDTLGDSDGKSPGFSIKNCDFPIKNGDFPIQNGDFAMNSMVIFPLKMVIFPLKIVIFPLKIVIFPLKIVIFPLNMVIFPLNMVIFPLKIVIFPLKMVIFP